MQVAISKDQQKVFVDNFLQNVELMAIDLVDNGNEARSPGETVWRVGQAIITELEKMETKGNKS